ncbi:MAG TPA: nitrogenase-stabilizing/protective protein NifW [Crinalium sp.]|jgi:nitrogenase-stabilizing/protective protein
MSRTLSEFNQITDAEQYFEFFELPYDPQVVNVNRLHILRKFSQHMENIDAASTSTTETERLEEYRNALQQAYDVFLSSSAIQQKLFKVFNQKPQNVVLLKEISAI